MAQADAGAVQWAQRGPRKAQGTTQVGCAHGSRRHGARWSKQARCYPHGTSVVQAAHGAWSGPGTAQSDTGRGADQVGVVRSRMDVGHCPDRARGENLVGNEGGLG